MSRSASPSLKHRKSPPVKVFTLGRFALEVDGHPVRFGGKQPRKPLELVKALIAQGGDGVSVEQLCDSLWPDLEGDKAYNAFKSALSRLRKLIGHEALIHEGGRLTLAPETCWADALEFEELLAEASRALNGKNTEEALRQLEKALALYRGPFLDGEFEPVEILAARERLHGLFLRHVTQLGDALRQGGQAQKAIQLYQQGLDIDDVSEEICLHMMECLRREGRLGEAIAAFQRLQQALQTRIGTQPSPEAETLHRKLLAQHERQSPPEEEPIPPPDVGETPAPPGAEPAIAQGGERRNVTAVVFLLSGLTALGESRDPEETEKAIRSIREEVQGVVEEHGGVVNQFLRDEVVAFFGIPTAHEDDPLRAVRAARAVGAALDGAQGGPAGKGGLSMQAGIDTGLVVVKPGEEGSGRHAVTGTALTRAAELAAAARKTQLLISGETQRRVAPYFELKEISEGKTKKKNRGAPHFLVVDESVVQTRFEAAEMKGLTEFSGREPELVALRGCLDQALAGQGRFATVMGEAGIGKSRLLHEFRQGLDREQVNVLEGRCQSTGENTPYLPLIDALRQGLRLSDEDSPETLVEKVAANTLAIDPALEPNIPLYLHLLSIQDENYPLAENLKGEDLRAAIGQALGAIITQSALRQPLVFILEDWHWTDEASDTALRFLLGLVASVPLLLIVSLRPEYGRAWPNLSFHAHLVLQPLLGLQGIEIVRSAFGVEELPEALGEMIHGRTGGNPFFIEEMCNNLLEEGIVRIEGKKAILADQAAKVVLPGTVQAVIRSRLDRLDPQSRGVLQLAAVIGREFDLRILEQAHADPSSLLERLEGLKAQEILRQTRMLPDPVYQFNHVLTQEVVYETLLLQRRRDLHVKVGQVIEEMHAGHLNEHVEALADHMERGGIWDKAIQFHVDAGIKAKRNHFMKPALHHFDRAMEILQAHDPDIPWRLHYDLLFERKDVLGEYGRWPQAVEELGAAKEIADREGDQPLKIQTMFARAMGTFWAQLFTESMEELAELERLVSGDPEQMLGVAALQMFVSIMQENFSMGLVKEKETIDWLGQAPNSPHAAAALWFLGVNARWRGNHRKAVEIFEALLPMVEDKEGIERAARTLTHYCMALVEQGQNQHAISLMESLLDKGEKAGSIYSILRLTNTLGWAYQEIFNLDKAFEHNNQALTYAVELRGPRHDLLREIESFARLNLADIHLFQGNLDEAEEMLEITYQNANEPAYALARPRWKPRCLIALGELSLNRGNIKECERYLAELDSHGLTDLFPFTKIQVRAGHLKGALLKAKGEPEEAETELNLALRRAIGLDMPGVIWRSHRTLADFYGAENQDKKSRSHYRKALKVVQEIAGTLTEPKMKEQFLESKPILELTENAKGS